MLRMTNVVINIKEVLNTIDDNTYLMVSIKYYMYEFVRFLLPEEMIICDRITSCVINKPNLSDISLDEEITCRYVYYLYDLNVLEDNIRRYSPDFMNIPLYANIMETISKFMRTPVDEGDFKALISWID